ncbi:MAG TPA: hypothetical protein VMZ31_02670 [Phycisphaerae bacterium]|nr:hypothetical protein [Phycisphaerae bacterium]
MSDWLQWIGDWRIGVLCALVALLVMVRMLRRVGRWWRGRRPARLHPKLQALGEPDERLVAERRKQAATILATSSTGSIPGYHIIEQIEAVYVDGFRRPDEAIEGLKATAAMKGANALINVRHEHSTTGRHAGVGDAVIVRKLSDGKNASPPAESSKTETDSKPDQQ